MSPKKTNDKQQELESLFNNGALYVDDKKLDKEITNNNDDANLHNEILKKVAISSLKNHKQKRKLKKPFFWIVMSMYIMVILGSIATMVVVPIFCREWYAILPSVGAALASIITALIKIPAIIADYLFPKGEDDLLIDLSTNVFKHDEAKQRLKNGESKKGEG